MNQEDVTSNKRNFILCKWDDYNSNTYGFPFDVRITNQSYSINGQIFSYRRGLVSCNQLSETKSNSKVNDNKWHHIVTVKQNAQLKLYVDGNLEYTNTDITTCNTGNTFEMYMGKKGGTWVPGFYKGYLDEVMIFSCALSNNTIDSLFNPASHTPTEVVYSIEICKDDSVLLEANINGPFKWLLEKSPVILSNDSFIKVSPLRKTTYVLTNNINDTTRFIITVDSIEDVFLGNDTTICFGKVLLLGPLPIYDSIEWWDGSNKKINVIKKTGTYSVTVLKGECSSSDSISVEFEDCDTNFILPNPVIPDCRISIPNSFTPNGDTLNEFFAPVIYCDLKKYRLLIYNRWGDLIFESFSIYDGWDGTFKNVQVPSDTYAYLIKFTTIHGASGHKTGLLYLIR